MVSTVPSSGTQNPPLSYADRARKAQGIPPANAAPSPSASSRQPPRTSVSVTPAAPAPQKPIPQPPTPRSEEQAAEEDQSSPPAELASKPAEPNGDVKSAHASPVGEPSSASAPKQLSQPVVNVWDRRKAQMARGLAPRLGPESVGANAPRPTPPSASDQPPPLPPAPSRSINGSSSSVSQENGRSVVPPSPVDANESKSNTARDQPNMQQLTTSAAVPLPPLQDATAWPEVGKIAAAPVGAISRRPGKEREESKEPVAEKDGGATGQKKSEKLKWVPIPAEELQAAADAQRPNRSQGSAHGRSRSHQQLEAPLTSATPGGSASGRDSQNRSRTQSSVVRERRSGSQAGSTSHSRTQSRNGSLQSSPRHSAARRRLPEEIPGFVGAAPTSLRSSRAGSPQLHMPYPQDLSGTGVVLPTIRSGAQLGLMDATSDSPYYSAIIPGSHSQTPYASSPAVNSPGAPQYHLPPAPYPLPAMPVPTTFPVGVQPYSMYPPYTYGYGQPYMLWGGSSSGPHSQNISQTHSPSTYPAQLGNPDAIPVSPPLAPSMSRQGGAPSVLHPAPRSFDIEQPLQSGSSDEARPRVLSFGSIDIASSVASEAMSGESSVSGNNIALSVGSERAVSTDSASSVDPANEKYFPMFSVGLAPGDPGPSRKRVPPSPTPPSVPTAAAVSHVTGVVLEQNGRASDVEVLEAKVIDLTVKEPKWEFGTTTQEEDEDGDAADAAEFARLSARAVLHDLPPDLQGPIPSAIPPHLDMGLRLPSLGHTLDPTGLPPTPVPLSATALYASNTPSSAEGKLGDEWKVRDYGYGVGRPPRSAAQPFVPREARPRRGSYNGAEPFERGGYPVRRGRGTGRGFGRGRGAYGGDNFGRGRGGGVPRHHYPAAGSLAPAIPYDTTYYAVPPMPSGPYVPTGYEMYGQFPTPYPALPPPAMSPTGSGSSSVPAPTPVPITRLSFPLDPTRYYLLGQLEYYLSDDNLAQDLYLRKNMDAQGWIPIGLLVSFNRVKALTFDAQLVRDVLTLSSLVEVHSEWVRTHRWRNYVLPDAPPSPLDPDGALPYTPAPQAQPIADSGVAFYAEAERPMHEGEDDGEDEDEDDVEIVLGGDADQSWTQERKVDA